MSSDVPVSGLTADELKRLSLYDKELADSLDAALALGGEVALSEIQDISTARFLGRTTSGTGEIEQLTATQATAMLNSFTTALKGLVPASGAAVGNFLKDNGTWATPGSGLGWYNVLDHGLVADDSTDNRAALATLITTVIAAGGGTIYFPEGIYYVSFGTTSTHVFENLGSIKLRVLGDGPSSIINWGGDALNGSRHFFQFKNGVRDFSMQDIMVRQKNLTNPDASEQHHLIHLTHTTASTANNEHFKLINVHFGLVKGDAVNLAGNQDTDACHAAIAGTAASGAVAGPFTSPTNPQRVCVQYPAAWDGGSFTISGTDINGATISETIPAGVAQIVCGSLEFATVTGATKSAVGASANTATIGFFFLSQHVLIHGCTFNGFNYAGANPSYGYRAAIVAQRGSGHVTVRDCFLTGSDDQIIDFEPTSSGKVHNWTIVNNVIITGSPDGTAAPATAVSLFGNGNTILEGFNENCIFEGNFVVGCVVGGKTAGLKLRNNWIFANSNTAAPTSLIGFSETGFDLDIENNHLVATSGFAGEPIVVDSGGGYNPIGVRIRGNTIYWYTGQAISATDCDDVEVANNRCVYLAATTNTDDAINVTSPAFNTNRARIFGNTVEGSRGGGTLRRGITYGPAASGNREVTILDNVGRGIQTAGVVVNAGGTYSSPPTIIGNSFPEAGTPISVNSAVAVCVGGNDGGNAHYFSATDDPATIAAMDSVQLGSTFGGDNGQMYLKVATGSAGWRPFTGHIETTTTSGNLTVTSGFTNLSVTGTQAYTLPNGTISGQRMIVECTVAASTPKGTLTVTTPFSGDPSTYLFTAVAQRIEFQWDGAAWRVTRKHRVGSQTPVLGTDTVSGMVATVNLSITGTVSGALPNGAIPGELVQIRCTTANGIPAGTLTGTYKALDATVTTNALFAATTTYFVAQWDGTHWLVLFNNAAVFS